MLDLQSGGHGDKSLAHEHLSPCSIIRWLPKAGNGVQWEDNHWPYVTDFVVYQATGSVPMRGRWTLD